MFAIGESVPADVTSGGGVALRMRIPSSLVLRLLVMSVRLCSGKLVTWTSSEQSVLLVRFVNRLVGVLPQNIGMNE